ncbi:MAG: hypothetical protein ABIG84_06510 [archaeon]
MKLKEFIMITIIIFLLTSVVYPRPLCYQGESCRLEVSKTLSETAKATGKFFTELISLDAKRQAKNTPPVESISLEALIAFAGFTVLFTGLLSLTILKGEYPTKKKTRIDIIFAVIGTLTLAAIGFYNWNIFPGLFYHNVTDFLFIIMISMTTTLVYASLKNNWTLFQYMNKTNDKSMEEYYTVLTAWIITSIIYLGIYYLYSSMSPI